MSLGERIYKLRTEKEMSQGDLADALEVSRQSISKWETNGSVPELDKLVKLSEIFDISLDELILDKPRPETKTKTEPEPNVIYVVEQAPKSTQKTAGVFLLCFSAVVWLLVSLWGDVLSGLFIASPFVACGLICLFARKNAGLWCLWAIYAFLDLYFRFATGTRWGFVFRAFAYQEGMTIHLIVAWIWLLCYAGLTVATLVRFRNPPSGSLRKDVISAMLSWLVCILIWVLLWILAAQQMHGPVVDVDLIRIYSLFSSVLGAVREGFLVSALVFTARITAQLLAKRKTK